MNARDSSYTKAVMNTRKSYLYSLHCQVKRGELLLQRGEGTNVQRSYNRVREGGERETEI